MQRISAEGESPLVVECPSCSHREYAEFQISPEGFFDDVEVEYRRVVVVREGKKGRADEVRALRKLKPELGALPITEAAVRIESSRYIDLGVHPIEDARDILERAKAEGLNALLAHPDDDSMVGHVRLGFFKRFGAPVSIGKSGEDVIIIPFGWILIGIALVLAVILWLLFK